MCANAREATALIRQAQREGIPWTGDIDGSEEMVKELERVAGRRVDLPLLQSAVVWLMAELKCNELQIRSILLSSITNHLLAFTDGHLTNIGTENENPPTSLSKTAAAAWRILQEQRGKGLYAKEVVSALKERGIDIKETTFRRHTLAELRPCGVKNHPSRGGYCLDPNV